MSYRINKELTIAALKRAINKQQEGLIHHFNHGNQNATIGYQVFLRTMKLLQI
ncbi:hypothetical protein [Paraliobacillus sp. JSM ZJ581]|uniref:hypothetical protein n=1 Tax=Paraliobacillus sp. JSM ZJ581 TaxID=3342118 RepID=UPI0035A8A7A1